VGLPASIDNDIGHCGLAIGVDTAVNTIVDACDRISDTAKAHKRAFIVEVMGRQCGFLAMRSGIAAEADAILFGEAHEGEDDLVNRLREVLKQTIGSKWYKQRCLIIKSEGVDVPTSRLIRRLQDHLDDDAPGVEIRATILGHMVRGGRPSALDRVIGQRLAFAAVMALEKGVHDLMSTWDCPQDVGMKTLDAHVRLVPIGEVLEETRRILDGTSPVIRNWISMLEKVESLLVA
jgi:6-phosphofructokinase 1